MSILQSLLQQANTEAELNEDMSVATVGGTAKLYPAGYAFCRLVEYVEHGDHMQSHNGVAKGNAPEAQLGFAVWGEGIQNDDGTPVIMRPWPFNLSRNEKAKAYKLFKKLNYKGTAKRFSQLLGEGFLMKIVHTVPKKAGEAVKSVIDLEGFMPPFDAMSKQPYAIPAAPDNVYRLFLWEQPTLPMWQSLFVEGKWDDGKSKNRVQETCLSASNFTGSALETLLIANSIAYVIPPKPVTIVAPPADALPAAPALPSLVAEAVPAAPQLPVAAPLVAVPATPLVAPVDLPWVAPVVPAMPNLPVLPTIPQLPTV
jgi:hypothetical protein